MGPKSIIFVRHAQSIGNTVTQDERANWDIPNHAYQLTDTGKQQAEMAGKYLKSKLNSNISYLFFQSTFLRTQMTMGIILNELKMLPLIFTDSRLDEKWDGIYHDLSKADIQKLYPEQNRLRDRSGYYHYRAPCGESCPDVELRIRSFLSDPMVVNQHIVIVGHGRWAILFHKILFDLTVEEFLKLKTSGLKDGGTKNCSVIEYQRTPFWSYKCNVPWEGQLPEQETELA
ncbi:MAG TPA: histidine phosphatase family protein [Candidatus Paceibacterota bacterium]